ncbi:ATP-binding protein [Phenylobacterium sp.]|uniref:ATP-binding protein n=1 Tax=Phenylobacterium sp. TaxID=1871053 RepID=UPI002EDB63BC
MHGAVELLERDEPRARLEDALAAARKGRGRVVSLEGEAGIGKTSLTLAFAEDHRSDARVHVGGCENLATPEPLGPLRDIARESQGRFALSPSGQLATYEALLRLLTGGRGPALLVLEDIHWADDATLDLLRFLGRRIRAAGVLVLVSFRNDEPDSQGRLASLWADMPRDARERIELPPLSLEAVGQLVHRQGGVARRVYELTGGNPFQVTEYLSGDGESVPRSVQEVTLARAARLSPHARRTLESASIFPRRIDEPTLRLIAQDADHAGVEECLAAGMLQARGGVLAFRHELARRAVAEAMSPLRRRELHAAALALLKGRNDGRAAEVAHHAEQAGAVQDLLAWSVRAAQQAAGLGAYREAMAHLSKVLEYGQALSEAERVQLLERKAFAAHFCGAFDEALQALDDVIAICRRGGNVPGMGNALRMSAHVHWNLGDPDRAEAQAAEAVRVLEAEPGSWQYALALASQAQFDMLADRNDAAIPAAEKALALAERLGRPDIRLQALTYLRTAHASTDLEAGVPALRATIDEARRLGEMDALPRLYANLTSVMAPARRHDGLLDTLDEGVAVCASRDQAPLEALIRGNRATALIDLGRLAEAVSEAEDVLYGPYPKSAATLPAMIALSRARVRLGLAEGGVLDQARRLPTARRDLLRRVPIAIADAEAHWLDGSRPGARERLAETLEALLRSWSQLWNIGEASLWLAILGAPPALEPRALAQLGEPHRAHLEGRWRDAAALWALKGCPYEQAIALSQGDEAAQREALAIFDRLGAAPAARGLRRRMRGEGVRSVPLGPRTARRENVAGLTRRQSEVLGLLADGMANADIAERLGLSAKTVEHHVSAILATLEAPSRLAAVQIARERGLSLGAH